MRRFRIIRLALLAGILAPLLYCSAFVSAAFLLGTGAIPGPTFQLLCETVFAPLLWIDGGNQLSGWSFRTKPGPSRLPWLFDTAYAVCSWGYRLTH